jgi:MFS family permease
LQLGYTSFTANLLSTPPWVAAFVFSMFIAWTSDHFAHRFLAVIIPVLFAITGFILLLLPNLPTTASYTALFLAVAGTFTAMPVVICWYNTNLGGHLKRSVGSAWQIGFGNIGGIIATYVFLPGTAPRFILGKTICIAWLGICIVSSVVYFGGCAWENRRRDKAVNPVRGTEEEMEKLGDDHPDFRYIL